MKLYCLCKGTASVALAGILAALKATGKSLKEHTFLFQVFFRSYFPYPGILQILLSFSRYSLDLTFLFQVFFRSYFPYQGILQIFLSFSRYSIDLTFLFQIHMTSSGWNRSIDRYVQGAGQAAVGIALLIAMALEKREGLTREEALSHVWLRDSKGTVCITRQETHRTTMSVILETLKVQLVLHGRKHTELLQCP